MNERAAKTKWCVLGGSANETRAKERVERHFVSGYDASTDDGYRLAADVHVERKKKEKNRVIIERVYAINCEQRT